MIRRWLGNMRSEKLRKKLGIRRLGMVPPIGTSSAATPAVSCAPQTRHNPPPSGPVYIAVDKDGDVIFVDDTDILDVAVKRFSQQCKGGTYPPYQLLRVEFVAGIHRSDEQMMEIFNDPTQTD